VADSRDKKGYARYSQADADEMLNRESRYAYALQFTPNMVRWYRVFLSPLNQNWYTEQPCCRVSNVARMISLPFTMPHRNKCAYSSFLPILRIRSLVGTIKKRERFNASPIIQGVPEVTILFGVCSLQSILQIHLPHKCMLTLSYAIQKRGIFH
jgi:hypothetical protein